MLAAKSPKENTMQIFVDTGIVDDVKEIASLGLADGVTTNPSLIAKSGRKREDVIKEMCEIVDGPISAEVIALDRKSMVKEGLELAKIHENIVVKIPLTEDGIGACYDFSKEGIKTNVTLCFSPLQAYLAAKNGATYISPFIGRLDDIGHVGTNLVEEIRQIYSNYGYETKILVASVRHPVHVRDAALLGADVVTMPANVIKQLLKHPLTDIGLEKFMADYNKSQ
jgi:transaldolase